MRRRSGALIAAALLVACIQPGVAFGTSSSSSRPESFPFAAIAEDALVVKKLLAVQNLIVADGARAIPSARSLAARIERGDDVMEGLSAGVIKDADTVASAERRVRRKAHGTVRSEERFTFKDLSELIRNETAAVKAKLVSIETAEAISIHEMFAMQMAMNHLSQLSEMSTSVMSAANASIASMARNVKG
jgi:Family of unknown function (DUF5407)